MTPFLFACSTGVVDIAYYLAMKDGFNTWHLDGYGRGAIQLASNSQGDRQRLAHWLRWSCWDDQGNRLPDTNAPGRPKEERTRGGYQAQYRWSVRYDTSKGRGATYDDVLDMRWN